MQPDVSRRLYKAAFGMAGFVMLSPTIAGFPDDPVSMLHDAP
jgi:hypothetical protein